MQNQDRRSHNRQSRNVYLFYLKMLVLAAVLGVVLEGFKSGILAGLDSTTMRGSILVCILTASVFSALLLAAGYIFKIHEVTTLADRIFSKIKYRKI